MNDKDFVIYLKRPKREDGYKVFSIRIKEDLADRINEIASQTGYSRNELIARFLEYAAEHCTVAEE